MIKLFDLKNKQEKEKQANSDGKKKVAPGTIRMQKDMSEVKLEKGVFMEFPNGKDDLMNFKVKIIPDDGIYRGGSFVFDFKIPTSYPHDAPKVLCETLVYHPNIDMEGHVCLNILREDWKPVLTIQSIIMGLQFLMYDPNPDDPLNKEAAESLSKDKRRFEHFVRETFKGRSMVVGNQRYTFPRFD
uniref:UBC core domain-containing protein n=1 Tax=Chrysotila carterae TaxID=13221 RepID=A0A6S9RK77_CHRCT|mmetsp:Transcript_13456/g.28549  ORF Transcript_13456/g.28549 Transcript_13456/m.28549 type:complete len:186 (+) Transcript_13456:141-698(+)